MTTHIDARLLTNSSLEEVILGETVSAEEVPLVTLKLWQQPLTTCDCAYRCYLGLLGVFFPFLCYPVCSALWYEDRRAIDVQLREVNEVFVVTVTSQLVFARTELVLRGVVSAATVPSKDERFFSLVITHLEGESDLPELQLLLPRLDNIEQFVEAVNQKLARQQTCDRDQADNVSQTASTESSQVQSQSTELALPAIVL